MPLFWKHYKSDVTAFIEQMKITRPALEDEQRAGRALLWDKLLEHGRVGREGTRAELGSDDYIRQAYLGVG